MIFNKSYQFRTKLSREEIKKRLTGKHIQIHNVDFEVQDREAMLKVIPQTESSDGLGTLPITHVEFESTANDTRIKISAKPRKIDIGGPYLIIIFSFFCIIGGLLFYWFNQTENFWSSIAMIGFGVLVFSGMWWKMQSGYFDYIRKIKQYVRNNLSY